MRDPASQGPRAVLDPTRGDGDTLPRRSIVRINDLRGISIAVLLACGCGGMRAPIDAASDTPSDTAVDACPHTACPLSGGSVECVDTTIDPQHCGSCSSTCGSGQVCVQSMCMAASGCGTNGTMCCASTSCVAPLECCSGTCLGACPSCGGAMQPCCTGMCSFGAACDGVNCFPCGGSGQPCCDNSSASPPCSSGLACVGTTCATCGAMGDSCVRPSDCCDGFTCFNRMCQACNRTGGTCSATMPCCFPSRCGPGGTCL